MIVLVVVGILYINVGLGLAYYLRSLNPNVDMLGCGGGWKPSDSYIMMFSWPASFPIAVAFRVCCYLPDPLKFIDIILRRHGVKK